METFIGNGIVKGNAAVDTTNILDTKFRGIHVGYEPAQWMKDVAQFFEDAGKAVVQFVENAVAAVKELATLAIAAIKDLVVKFTFIGTALVSFGAAIGDLFSGDFAGALKNLGDALGELVNCKNWAVAGLAVLDFFGWTTETKWPGADTFLDCSEPSTVRIINNANKDIRKDVTPAHIEAKCATKDALAAEAQGCFLEFQLFQKKIKVHPRLSVLPALTALLSQRRPALSVGHCLLQRRS